MQYPDVYPPANAIEVAANTEESQLVDDLPVPASFDPVVPGPLVEMVPLSQNADGDLHALDFDRLESGIDYDPTARLEPGPIHQKPADRSAFSDGTHDVAHLCTSLAQRVALLEQRAAQPTEREQDLEMVLENVWQALVRCNSVDAQPESALWKLVKRFARNVLTTPTPPPAPIPPLSGGMDWGSFLASDAAVGNGLNGVPHVGPSSDSGYHSGRLRY